MATPEQFVLGQTGRSIALGDAVGSEFVASGTGAHRGLVPSPGAVAGTTHFLREDATWATAGTNYPFVDVATVYGVSTSNTAAANTTAFNNMVADINSGAQYGIFLLPRGVINTNAWNSITGNNAILQGMGKAQSTGTVLQFNTTSGNDVTFSQCTNCGFQDVAFTTNQTKTAGNTVYFTGSSGQTFRCFMHRCSFYYVWIPIFLGASNTTAITFCEFRQILGTAGLYVKGDGSGALVCTAYTILSIQADNPYPGTSGDNGTRKTWAINTTFNESDIIKNNGNIYQCTTGGQSAAAGTGPSGVPGTGGSTAFSTGITDNAATWKFVCNGTLAWQTIDSYAYSGCNFCSAYLNGNNGVKMVDGANTGTSYPKWHNFFNLQCDHSYANCINLTIGEGFYSSFGWYGSSLTGNGVAISGTGGDYSFQNDRIVGHWNHGILINTAANSGSINIIGCYVSLNSQSGSGNQHGITTIVSSRFYNIIGNFCGTTVSGSGQQGFGIFQDATNNHCTIMNNVCTGNATGSINFGTAASASVVAYATFNAT